MAGRYFKLISTITAFCPALLVYGGKQLYDTSLEVGFVYLILGLFGILLHYLLILQVRSSLPDIELTITEVTPADNRLLAYICGYFIPILEGSLLSGWHLIIIGALLFIVVAFSNATAYNPLYFIYCFHYFDIKDGQAIDKTIISKKNIIATNKKLIVKELGSYQYLIF